VEEVVDLWSTSGFAVPALLDAVTPVEGKTGAAASETAFKRDAQGHRILHLATHGFFLDGHCASVLDFSRGVAGLATAEHAKAPGVSGESPLLLSGLALAGANHRSEAGATEDDGILTAEEIAALDLSGVEWAVLSACDTGVGEIKAGEGVFGLRRAFQVAGARTLIMSLWSVEDESARAWMKALYTARLKEHLDTASSVQAASLVVLKERRAKKQSTHPFYWAGFVAAGDWR
jgi:CHAT domain-containing protein